MHSANPTTTATTSKRMERGVEGESETALSGRQLIECLFDMTSNFMIEHDRSGRVLHASTPLAETLGYDLADFGNLTASAIADPDYLESLEQCFRDGTDTDVQEITGTLRRRDGTGVSYKGIARTVRSGDARVLLANLREVQTQVHHFHVTQAQKLEAIGQLAAGIAHEINTPTQYVGNNVRFLQDSFQEVLAIIRPLLEFAEETERKGLDIEGYSAIRDQVEAADFDYLSTQIPKAITQTLEGVEHIAGIVRAMKEFSHPDVRERTLIRVNNAIESTITVAKNEWKYVAKVVTDFDPSLPVLSCYAGEFNQVLLNILVNAAHAIAEANEESGEVGTITISTRAIEGSIEIRFKDTGTGIPEHAQSRIFDPFFTTKEVGKGTGQGLALAYAIVVENHGGTISFETELGKGTTFIIRIPIAGPAAAEVL